MADDANICRKGENCCDAKALPIVFVPGCMGSRLTFPNAKEDWDPDRTWAMMHWLRISAERERDELHYWQPAQVMQTKNSKIDPPLKATEQHRGWEGVFWESYGEPLLRFLRNLGYPVYAAGYDWRQDIQLCGQRLEKEVVRIMDVEKAEKAILITHSMGGVVARAALKQSQPLSSKVAAVLHVAQPVAGAVVFYRRFFTGGVSEWDGGWGLTTIMGDTADKFATVVSGLPGPMQLLPTHLYSYGLGPWIWTVNEQGERPIMGDVYDHYLSSKIPPGIIEPDLPQPVRSDLTQRLFNARSFHSWLGDYKLEQKTWTIYGVGLETDHYIKFDPIRTEKLRGEQLDMETPNSSMPPEKRIFNHDAVAFRPAQGDETVPGPSASRLFRLESHRSYEAVNDTNHQFVVVNAGHQDIFKSQDVKDIIGKFIKHAVATSI